ncbi:MAG: CbbQ/NirQ/NorQ C-terminal domain-containing protein, partial [Nitrosopumilus sp.]
AEVQDASTLDRIGAHIEVKYLSKPQEVSILTKHTELNKEVIKAMVDFGNKVREAFNNQQIMTTFSVRSLLAWAEKIELTGSIEGGLSISWYTKLSDDDKALTGDMFHQIFARTIK